MNQDASKIYLLADNQDITSLGIEHLLGEVRRVRVTGVEALREALRCHPDGVVILDYALFDFESAAQMLNLRASAPASSWLLFSEELSRNFIREVVLQDQTVSIVFKSDSRDVIAEALRRVAVSQSYLCPAAEEIVRSRVVIQPVTTETLTPSEKNVLRQIAKGLTTKEIAAQMNLSFHTINTHRKNIFRKIEVSNVQEAIQYAVRSGIADFTDFVI